MDTQQHKTVFGILSYLGPLVIVSFLVAKDDPFVKFHIKQGLVLLAIDAILWVMSWTFWMFSPLWMLYNLVNLAILVLVILGIMNVVNNKEQELPIVGSFAKNFTF
jgi:uncharacterized membrane protein